MMDLTTCDPDCTDPDWNRHCGDLWRDHVQATTGADICAIVGPSPRSPAEWAAMMRRLGVRDMAGVLATVHGEPVPRRQVRRGWIVRRGWAIGICRGEDAEFYGGVMLPMREVDEGYRVALPPYGHKDAANG